MNIVSTLDGNISSNTVLIDHVLILKYERDECVGIDHVIILKYEGDECIEIQV